MQCKSYSGVLGKLRANPRQAGGAAALCQGLLEVTLIGLLAGGPQILGECKPFLRYFARPLNPCASIGILKMVMAVFRTLAGVVISLPSGPSAPLPTTYSVLLPGPENAVLMPLRGVGIMPRYFPSGLST